MKRTVGNKNYTREENRTNPAYIGSRIGMPAASREHFRWFCGLLDMDYSYVCQKL